MPSQEKLRRARADGDGVSGVVDSVENGGGSSCGGLSGCGGVGSSAASAGGAQERPEASVTQPRSCRESLTGVAARVQSLERTSHSAPDDANTAGAPVQRARGWLRSRMDPK